MNTFEMDKTYIANTYKRFPVEIADGHGSILTDVNGKQYIDLGSGIAVNLFGANDEVWKKAVIDQMNHFSHTSNLYYTAPQAKLAKLLCEKTGMKRVFFANSGAESNECAIKVARKYAADKYGDEVRPVVITLTQSFHGRTIATLTATGQDVFHHSFGPFVPGFAYAKANDIEDLKKTVAESPCCAIMMEMVQGEGGVNPLDKEFVQAAAKLCAENDMLLIVDEVQSGNGRTGTLYAYQQFGITPDVVTTAKGLGGGLPIGACMIGEKAQDTMGPSSHGSTFGGNPLCAAGALSVLERIDEQLLAGVNERHDLIVKKLMATPGVQSVTGLGLMLGVKTDKPAADVVRRAIELGALPLTAKDKIRLLPPLNIPMDQLEKAIDILAQAISE